MIIQCNDMIMWFGKTGTIKNMKKKIMTFIVGKASTKPDCSSCSSVTIIQ